MNTSKLNSDTIQPPLPWYKSKVILAVVGTAVAIIVIFFVIQKIVDETQYKKEEQAWAIATVTNSKEGYKAYLTAWPQGRYAIIAGNLLTELDRQQAQQTENNSQKPLSNSTVTNIQSEGQTEGSSTFAAPEMVFIQGGTFTMGCTAEQGDECFDGEMPAHRVSVSDYYIGKYEVTQAQWRAVMGTTIKQQRDRVNQGSSIRGEGDSYPMYYVNWDDVQEFIERLNATTGQKYRLPTEAEWEFAARGGNNGSGYKYSGSNNVDNVAWYDINSKGTTHPVGTKRPNELGIYDMSGNIWEWCSDWYDAYNSHSQIDPQGPVSGSGRVYRGGSWFNLAGRTRVSLRGNGSSDFSGNYLGFRLACSP